MKRENPWEKIISLGNYVVKSWEKIASENDIELETFGLPSLSGYKFVSDNHLKYKTYITQEMLKKGYLASNLFYSSFAHSKEILKSYINELSVIFATISSYERRGQPIDDLLEGPVCHEGFNRLN